MPDPTLPLNAVETEKVRRIAAEKDLAFIRERCALLTPEQNAEMRLDMDAWDRNGSYKTAYLTGAGTGLHTNPEATRQLIRNDVRLRLGLEPIIVVPAASSELSDGSGAIPNRFIF